MNNHTQPSFSKKVYDVVRKIPRGKVMTYAEVAEKAGNKRASRAVGYWMSKNYDPKIPCHRVVRSDGTIGNYNRGGPKKKFELLHQEGYRG
jgi:O-6-methylguanine DNA methyltransferase